MRGTMLVIDTHCHAGISWMEPVESLLYQMDLNGVAKALLVQHGGSYDNGYLLESVQRFPGRFGVVLGLDPLDPEAPLTLGRLAERPGVVGLRLAPESPPALWRKAGQLGLPVSCVLSEATEAANPSFQHMVKDLPGGTIVLEHLAGAYVPRSVVSVTEPYTAYLTALSLAQYPNIYIKFGGLGEICPRPPRLRTQFGFDVVPTGTGNGLGGLRSPAYDVGQ